MGSFLGHLANGTIFVLYALLWTIYHAYESVSGVCRRPMRTRRRHKYVSRCCHPPVIGMALLFCSCVAAFLGENLHSTTKFRFVDKDGNWVGYGIIWQHCTMAVFFALYSLTNLLKHTCLPSAEFLVMPIGSLAFFVEGLLFICHAGIGTYYEPKISTLIHFLLVVSIFACFITTLCESFTKNRPLLPYIRILFTLHQGTWLWQIAFILYPPSGHRWESGPGDLMYASMFFFWHIFADLILLLVLHNITRLFVRVFCRRQKESVSTHNGGEFRLLDDEVGMDEISPCLEE